MRSVAVIVALGRADRGALSSCGPTRGGKRAARRFLTRRLQRGSIAEEAIEEELINEQREKRRRQTADQLAAKSTSMTRRSCGYIAVIYPWLMSLIPGFFRRGFKLLYSFFDGFGRTCGAAREGAPRARRQGR